MSRTPNIAFALLTIGLVVLSTTCNREPRAPTPPSSNGEWMEFQGTWTAVGDRNTIRLGDNRRASISTFNGTLMLAGPSRPDVGLRSDAIVFSDTETGVVGRAVWTDEHGDQAYSEIRGEGTTTNNKIHGTFVGGTGRYSGITGTYEFSWRFILENEDGLIQGQSMGLSGRARLGAPGPSAGGAR